MFDVWFPDCRYTSSYVLQAALVSYGIEHRENMLCILHPAMILMLHTHCFIVFIQWIFFSESMGPSRQIKPLSEYIGSASKTG